MQKNICCDKINTRILSVRALDCKQSFETHTSKPLFLMDAFVRFYFALLTRLSQYLLQPVSFILDTLILR